MKFKHVYQNEAGEGAASGSGGVVIDPKEFETIKAELERFKIKHQESEKHLKEKEKLAREAAEEAAKKAGDIQALEKSWQEKLAAEVASRDSALSAYQQTISSMTVGASARTLAAELALPGSAEVLLPHIERRLKVEMGDGQALIRVLDKAGKPSAMSLDDLKKEIANEKAFAPLLVGSMASGSGDVGKKGEAKGKSISREAFDRMTDKERSAFAIGGGKVTD